MPFSRFIILRLNIMDSFKPPPARVDHCFAVRISVSEEQLTDVFEEVSKMCEGLMVVAHNASDNVERNHVHMAIYNSKITHDPFRRALLKILKECLNTEDKGNALMSVKKFDGSLKYLVYMLKGQRHAVCYNNVINEEYIAWLRMQWVSQSEQESLYQLYKRSPQFYTKPKVPLELLGEIGYKSLKDTEIFDQLRESVLAFVLPRNGGYVNAKVRYETKDIISNYCLFNKVKMLPLYI